MPHRTAKAAASARGAPRTGSRRRRGRDEPGTTGSELEAIVPRGASPSLLLRPQRLTEEPHPDDLADARPPRLQIAVVGLTSRVSRRVTGRTFDAPRRLFR